MASVDVVRSEIIDIGGADWDELMPGISAKRLWSDAATNRICMFTRFSPGAALPRHAHNGDELVFVLEGVVEDEFGAITAGNVGYRPDGCVHNVRSDKGATALAVVTGGVGKPGEGEGPSSVVFDLATTAWVDALPGVRQKRFWADAAAGRSAAFSRFEPGAQLPSHRHDGDELVFVIEGTLEDEAGVLRPGQLGYRPNGCEHHVASPNGATVVAFLWGGVAAL